MPSIAELRAVCQPESLLGRVDAEHWAGRLYMRRLSPYVTRLLIATPLTPNGVTWLMIASGLLAALSLTFPGPLGALGAFVLIQLQLLFDCCDGEVARWRRRFSPTGVYLDGIGHYSTDAALAAALGVRAAGGWDSIDGWTTLGLLVAVLVLFLKSESHLVEVARAHSGKPPHEAREEASAPRPGALRRMRRAVRFLPFFRAFLAVEATLLALAAALVDAFAGGLSGTRALLLALVPLALLTVAGHLIAILASKRLA
ncbi:MAG: CDP-alcohol phosphatidyltransferase family protein [Actinomycetota bacterium]|nr:CDP-alcohol phosphatidyltransferase family protein [Actinomycetota bacterium]